MVKRLNSDIKKMDVKNAGFMTGGGEMGERIRAFDWSKTAVGPVDTWPQSLRTTLSILLNSKFPMFLWWGEELIQFYNDGYRPSLGNNGKHPAALGEKGKNSWPETWPIIKPLIDQVRSGGEATWNEDQLVPIYRNGKIEDVYWTYSFSPVYDESGNVGGVLVVCNETTEKVMNVKKLEESESRFRHLIEQAPVAITLTRGQDVVIESINAPTLRIMGKKHKEEVLGKKIVEVLPEIKDQSILEIIKDVLETREPFRGIEVPVNLQLGENLEQHYFNVSYTPLIEKGEVSGVIHVAVDVTEQVIARKKTEESKEELKRFKFMADQARDAFVLMREDGTFAYLNKKAMEVWGYTPEELRHMRVPDVDPVYQKEQYLQLFAQAQKENIPQFETLHKRKDGHIYPVEVNVVGLVIDEKPLLFAVARDITQRKQAEEAMKLKNKQLLRINNDLDNFIYTASHDLKAPITNIEGLVHVLQLNLPAEVLESERVQRIMGMMKESVERFKKTIANLTEVVKLQKEHSGEAVPMNLMAVIEEVLPDLEQIIDSSGAQIEIDVADCPTVHFSEKNLRSVIYNLLSNSLKYSSPDRAPLIQIHCKSSPGYHVLSVKDNGLGIAPRRISQLFTMFRRFHSHVEGTGIGLYMIKKMIENADGRIEVESQLGEGTTFRVYFKS